MPIAGIAGDDCPCFDGWSYNNSGASKVWNPTKEDLALLLPLLPDSARVCCWHTGPDDGKVTAIYDDGGELKQYISFHSNPAGFTVDEEGVIVSVHH